MTSTSPNILIVDLETTGPNGPPIDSVVEVAIGMFDPASGRITAWAQTFCEPSTPISYEAMSIHHITPSMCAGWPPFERFAFSQLGPADVIVAHSRFEKTYLDHYFEMKVPYLDTLQSSRHIFQDAASYRLQYLRYYLDLDVVFPELNLHPHRALYDVFCTASLLRRLLETHPLEDLIAQADTPVVSSVCRFGRKWLHKPMSAVPTDYLTWFQANQQLDEDTAATIEAELRRRNSLSKEVMF